MNNIKEKGDNLIISIIKNRSDFLYIAQGDRASGRFLSLQARNHRITTKNPKKGESITDDMSLNTGISAEIVNNHIGYGITASKKVGNAVMRNRAKRRLRVLLRSHLPKLGQAGKNYVAIARPQTVIADWQELEQDFLKTLEKLSKPRKKPVKETVKTR